MLRVALLLALLGFPTFAAHEVYLKDSNQIPIYAQQTNVWCGAATAQMILEGFPNNVNHTYPQRTIWDKIQTLKVEGWYTDPDGLERVLVHYGTGTRWRAHCVKDSRDLMRFMVAGMTKNQYPVGALVYGAAHWIMVIGATTDYHPLSLGGANLEKIEAFDPWKAQHVLVSGTTWFEKYWYKPVGSGKWSGCYLIVHENSGSPPPLVSEAEGVPSVEPGPRRSLGSAEVKQLARRYWFQAASELRGRRSLFPSEAQEPVLVHHVGGDYFLVPVGDRRTGLSWGAVMLGATSGEWQGVSFFAEPHRYLTQELAREWLGAEELRAMEWIFSPSEQSRSPFHPVLRWESDRGPRYLDQSGRLSDHLSPLNPQD